MNMYEKKFTIDTICHQLPDPCGTISCQECEKISHVGWKEALVWIYNQLDHSKGDIRLKDLIERELD